MKILGGLLATIVTLLVISNSQAMRGHHKPPFGYRYAKRPIYSARRITAMRRTPRVVPARRVALTRSRITPAKSIYGARRQATKFENCPATSNVDVRSVVATSLRRINNFYGEPYAVKAFRSLRREICSKCDGGRCVFDHNSVKITAIIAKACRSDNCHCGVERFGIQKNCMLRGWTKPGEAPYNIRIECDRDRIWPPRRIPTRPGITATRVSTTRATIASENFSKSGSTTTKASGTTTTLVQEVPDTAAPEEFDISADGPSSSEKPKETPIVEWDERTSKATVIYPQKAVSGNDDEVVQEEELLQ